MTSPLAASFMQTPQAVAVSERVDVQAVVYMRSAVDVLIQVGWVARAL